MRRVKWPMAAALFSILIGGCTNPQREAGRRLAECIDEARRLYNYATVLLADPQYILDLKTGRLSLVAEILEPGAVESGETGKAANPLELLEEAHKRLVKALSENAEAPVSTQADAKLMLGQIQLALGRYHVIGAERARTQASQARGETENLLILVGGRAALVAFYGSLEKKPRDEILKMRERTAKQAKDLAGQIDSATEQIAKLEQEIDQLKEEKGKLSAQAASHYDQAQLLGGAEGLEQQTKAAKIDRKINRKEGEIAARQQKIGYLKSELGLWQKDRLSAETNLAALDRHLKDIDKRTSAAAKAKKDMWSRAAELQKQAEAAAADVVKHSETATAYAQQAREALAGSLERLADAEAEVRKEWHAARRAQSERAKTTETEDEILVALANDQHLASVIGLRASASLALAELGRYELDTARVNDALAKAITKTAGLLGQADPPITKRLVGYVTDKVETRETAERSYEAAEKDLEDILKTHLRGDEISRNIRWIYQAKLAEAYLGHYLLTRKQQILNDAKKFIEKATAGREASPYLRAVAELKRLILNAPPPQ